MRKLLTLVLVCALLLAAMPAALAQTVAPGAKVTVEFPFSGKAANLVHAIYTIPAGLTFVEGEVDGWTYGKAGKTQAIYASLTGITSGTLKLTLKAAADAKGDLAVAITHLQGYAPSSWIGLTGKATKTVTVSGGAAGRVPGDADGNGKVDIDDPIAILQHLAYWGNTINLENADCDGKAGLNIDDAIHLLQYLAFWGVELK